MGKVYERVDGRLREFVERQPVFFVATAPLSADGHVDVSPRGARGAFEKRGPEGSAEYRRRANRVSLDGLPAHDFD